MATSPCQPISPAVTHTLSWQVKASPHTSENFQVGYLELATPNEEIEKFTAFLISNGVTGTPTVAGDGVVRHASVYIEPNTYPCSYRLRSGLGFLRIEDGTYNQKEFRNLLPYAYIGNSSDGCIVIDYNGTTESAQFGLTHPRNIAMNAIRAIDHVNATICRAYPVATRVIPDPPPPLQIDAAGFDANENISMTTSFRIFAEYRGPDGKFSNFINAPSNMWTYASGKNEAILDWGYEYKPYMSLAGITTSYYGSTDFIKFFFDDMNASQIQEGQYEILNYPWRLPASGNVTYEWGTEGVKSFPVAMSGESGAVVEFSNFYRNEDYLHNHTWYIKFLRFVSTHFEIVTIPPLLKKITEFTRWFETLPTPNTGPNAAEYPYVYQYKMHVSYKSTAAKEVTRTEASMALPPVFETADREREYPWTGATYEDLPTPVPENKVLSLLPLDSATINLTTNQQVPEEYWGKEPEEYWSPNDENSFRYWSFHYKLRIHYLNIGEYQPNNIPPIGITEWRIWHGTLDQDQPDPITEDFEEYLNFIPHLKIKFFGIYKEGEFAEDREYEIQYTRIDCSQIGGMGMEQNIKNAVNFYKAHDKYPLGMYVYV